MTDCILLKLQPNQDVTLALEAFLRDAGMECATIIGSVGSIVQGVLLRDDGTEIVEGPGIEVASLCGNILAAGGTQLHGHLCSADASVKSGVLAPGLNAVSVTFELIVREFPV